MEFVHASEKFSDPFQFDPTVYTGNCGIQNRAGAKNLFIALCHRASVSMLFWDLIALYCSRLSLPNIQYLLFQSVEGTVRCRMKGRTLLLFDSRTFHLVVSTYW